MEEHETLLLLHVWNRRQVDGRVFSLFEVLEERLDESHCGGLLDEVLLQWNDISRTTAPEEQPSARSSRDRQKVFQRGARVERQSSSHVPIRRRFPFHPADSTPFRRTRPSRTWSRSEPGGEISDEVLWALQADREPHDVCTGASIRRNGPMCERRRVLD